MSTSLAFMVTCEHGGHGIPRAYRSLFRGQKRTLQSHRGYDPGALDVARYLSRRLACPLEYSTVSRLLVDLNRSVGHPDHFSEITRVVDEAKRAAILRRHYEPHRKRVESRVVELVSERRTVLHIASHSFTPHLDGQERTADVAWLYDSGRSRETGTVRAWRDALKAARPELRLRRNYPYRGSADGLTTALRRRFPASRYLGVELEVNQRWFFGHRNDWHELKRSIAAALIASVRDG